MQMQRPPVNGTADAGVREFVDEFVPVDVQKLQIQPDRKQMPGTNAIRFVRRHLDLPNRRKTLDVLLRDLFALPTHCLSAIQLMDTDRSRNVRQVVLETRRHDLVIPASVSRVPTPCIVRQTVKRHELHPLREPCIVGNCHSAFAGGDGLVCVERIAGDAFGAVGAMLPRCVLVRSPTCRESMRGIFDDP